MKALSSGDVWAAGATGEDVPFVEHWNGSAWTIQTSATPGHQNDLHAVTALSDTNAWAVGGFQPRGAGTPQAWIEHWNGSAWKTQVASKNTSELESVAATSAANAWAVGLLGFRTPKTLIEHWNGSSWKVQPSPNRGTSSSLSGVAATSAKNAWAVGDQVRGEHGATLIERWSGSAWKIQPSPNP